VAAISAAAPALQAALATYDWASAHVTVTSQHKDLPLYYYYYYYYYYMVLWFKHVMLWHWQETAVAYRSSSAALELTKNF